MYYFALILDEYKSILKTLFICILRAHEIYISPLHCSLLHFFYLKSLCYKGVVNFSWFDNLLHYVIKSL